MKPTLISPHASDTLKPCLLATHAREAERERAATLPRVRCSSREAGDLIMLGIGGFTPLSGFMAQADWVGVCEDMHTAQGVFWPIPITLSTDEDTAGAIDPGSDVALVTADGAELLATMTVTEKYTVDKMRECRSIFRTTEIEHPGVAMVMRQGAVNLAGPVRVLGDGGFAAAHGALFLTPAETRALFERKGWSSVAAFQTRNPMHRSHEYLAKIAVETCDGVLIHSLLGNLKAGDIPADVRARAIAALIEGYFVPDTVVHAGYPLDMRYAGPRAALLHALFRQNYGCSHLLVGRDHAGVGDYYGPFDAHHIFDEIPTGALAIKAMKIDWTFWCKRCASMASMRTCPHEPADRLLLSGTKLRKLLSEDQPVPDNFSRPEVLAVLREYYRGLSKEDNVEVTLAGHSAR